MYDVLDSRGVPATRGVPVIVQLAAIIGVAVVFAIGASVVGNAGYGHVWPSAQSQRVPLGTSLGE